MSVTLAQLAIVVDAKQAAEGKLQLEALAQAGGRAEVSAKGVGAAHNRLATEMRKTGQATDSAAASTEKLAQAEAVAASRAATLQAAMVKQAAAARLSGAEALNLSRQFSDMAVMASMGASGMQILISQGPQVADVFQMAAARGVSLRAALAGIATAAGPVIALIGGFQALGMAIDEMRRITEGADAAHRNFIRVMIEAEEAINGVAIATYKLADARKQSAAQAIRSQIAENQKQISDIENPGALGLVGRGLGTIVGAYRGLEVQQKLRQLREENALLMQRSIQLFVSDSKAANDNAKSHDGVARAMRSRTQAAMPANHATDESARASEELDRALQMVLRSLETPMERALRDASERMLVLREALEAGKISADQFRAAIDKMFPEAIEAVKPFHGEITTTEERLEGLHEEILSFGKAATEQFYAVADAARSVQFAVDDIVSALKRGDGLALGGGILSLLTSIGGAFKMGGISGGVGAIAGTAGELLGGRVGKVLGGVGLGAGMMSMGSQLGAWAAAQAGQAALLGTTVGPLASMAGTLAPFLGPIGIIAGLATALSGLLGGKPSNHAGLASLTPDSFKLISSGKETDDTRKAATATAQTILQGEALLKSFGVTLAKTVAGVDIGSRDKTAITLSDGTKFRTGAVGDPAEAAEAALKAVLEGATYVDDTQKKLVESMRAAGKGFDELATTLQAYKTAQAISGDIADQILQLTDPKSYDLKGVEAGIQAQRDAAKAASDAGYITAEVLATINGQLDTLKGLQIGEVLKRYGGGLEAARDELRAAYDAEADQLRDRISAYAQVAQSLHAFADSLKAPGRGLTGAASAFQALAGRTDLESLGKVEDAGKAYLQAATEGATSRLQLARVQAQVRGAVEGAAKAADSQVSIAQQQLDAMTAQVNGLLQVNKSVLTVTQAVQNLQLAMTGSAPPAAASTLTANDNFDIAAYIASHPALSGRPSFATGGSITPSGPESGDRVPVTWMMNGGETAFVSRQDSMQGVLAELRAQNALLREQNRLLGDVAKTGEDTNKTLRRVSLGGTALRTTAA